MKTYLTNKLKPVRRLLQMLHSYQYIQETEPDVITQNVLDEFATIRNDPSQVEKKLEEQNLVIVNFIIQFEDYTSCTRCGDNGRTDQQMIMSWTVSGTTILERASRMNDVHLCSQFVHSYLSSGQPAIPIINDRHCLVLVI